jgi:hypothetical protein
MTTCLLIQTEVGCAREVAVALQTHPDVALVEQVGGPYDVVVLVRSSDLSFGEGSSAGAFARRAPGVLRALECVILDEHALPAA